MRDIVLVVIHLAVTAAKLLGPGGARAIVAENLLLKHQLTVLRPDGDFALSGECVDHRFMNCTEKRSQRIYDHRLRDLVRATGDVDIIAGFGVPRSTALGWLRGDYAPVVSADVLDMERTRLQAEVLRLRQRV